MLITIIKNGKYKTGQMVQVSNNEAHALIDSGEGEIYSHKMMVTETKPLRRRKKK